MANRTDPTTARRLASRAPWQELPKKTGICHEPCGSLHLAYHRDELDVLEEFAHLAPGLGYECELLSANEVLRRSPAARRQGLLGGLWSATEMCVDARVSWAPFPKRDAEAICFADDHTLLVADESLGELYEVNIDDLTRLK